MSALFFDIETGPQPFDRWKHLVDPFPEMVPLGEFDPATVKCGNLGADKAAEKIAAAKAAHDAARKSQVADYAAAKTAYEQGFIDKAGLSAATGHTIAIGYYCRNRDTCKIDHAENGGEAELLSRAWGFITGAMARRDKIVGHNIYDFDLPFLVRRSWMLGVKVPNGLQKQNRFWNELFVDIRACWLMGQQWGSQRSSLDFISQAFGGPGKPDGIDGGDFHLLWKEDRKTAIAYLENDLRMTAEAAMRMGAA